MASRQIHKYEVGFGESKTVMRAGARLLHGAVQATATDESVFVWAEVPAAGTEQETRQIGYFGTGEPIPDGAEYVGTAITADTVFVWHVYELRGQP